MQMHFELYNKLPKVCFRICVLSSGWKNSREVCTLTGQWFLSQPLTAVAMKGVDACGRKPKSIEFKISELMEFLEEKNYIKITKCFKCIFYLKCSVKNHSD